jgi:hypothetical protein
MDAKKLADIQSAINKTIDDWVSQTVKDRFINRPVGLPKVSLWDKFKRGVANWFWGAKGDKHNKHRWTNRFGDELGVSESFDPSIFTLDEYKEIRGVVDSLERRLDEVEQSEEEKEFGKLRLMGLIRSAADELKGMLFGAVRNVISASPSQPPAAEPPAAEPPAAEPPAAEPPAASGKPAAGSKDGKTLRTLKPRQQNKKDKAASDPEAKPSPKKGGSGAATPPPEKAGEKEEKSSGAKGVPPPSSASRASRAEPSPTPEVSSETEQDEPAVDHEELRGFFYTDKDEPVNFAEKILGFFNTEKYSEQKKQLVKLWRSLLAERKQNRWTEQETRENWYRRMVLSDKFLNDISDATGVAKSEVKTDMIGYLSTPDA